MNVLVASSDQLFARMAAMKLEKWGHSVTTTYDGDEAFAHINSKSHRIVIAEWDLPGITGPELCQKIRGIRRIRDTYIIVYEKPLDVADHDADKEQLTVDLEVGADDYLSLPFNPLELQFRIQYAERLLNLKDELRDGPGTDTVAGALNEASFREFFRVILAQTQRLKGRGALMFVHIDNFQESVAARGSGPMRKLMVEIAKILDRTGRDSDLVSKIAEDEFCLMLQDTYWDKCEGVAEKIMLRAKSLQIVVDDVVLAPEVSVSMVNFPIDDLSSDETLDTADRIPYRP